MSEDICMGCKAKDPDTMTINGPMICKLKPEFNGVKCACYNCLVKSSCTKFDYECDEYYQFAKHQFTKPKTEELDIPCKSCDMFNVCIKKIEDLKIKQYGEDPDYISEDEHFQFHTDLMNLLCDCKILSEYFPYDIVSRDGLMVNSKDNNHYRHHEASKIEGMDEDEWLRRNQELFYFFLPYNVKSTE